MLGYVRSDARTKYDSVVTGNKAMSVYFRFTSSNTNLNCL